MSITDLGASKRCLEWGIRWGQAGSGWQHPGQGCLSPVPPLSPLQDALCTPARRLLQDSRDVPVTITLLRAERVLLFDDVLALLQVGWGWPEVWGLQRGLGG